MGLSCLSTPPPHYTQHTHLSFSLSAIYCRERNTHFNSHTPVVRLERWLSEKQVSSYFQCTRIIRIPEWLLSSQRQKPEPLLLLSTSAPNTNTHLQRKSRQFLEPNLGRQWKKAADIQHWSIPLRKLHVCFMLVNVFKLKHSREIVSFSYGLLYLFGSGKKKHNFHRNPSVIYINRFNLKT